MVAHAQSKMKKQMCTCSCRIIKWYWLEHWLDLKTIALIRMNCFNGTRLNRISDNQLAKINRFFWLRPIRTNGTTWTSWLPWHVCTIVQSACTFEQKGECTCVYVRMCLTEFAIQFIWIADAVWATGAVFIRTHIGLNKTSVDNEQVFGINKWINRFQSDKERSRQREYLQKTLDL